VGAHAKGQVKTYLPAGKGVNVARGLARLGEQAGACGFVGRNEQALFVESLRDEGVAASFTPVEGRTRTNTTILDPANGTTTHLREEGFAVGAEDLTRLRADLERELSRDAVRAVVFAGSLPVGLTAEQFAALVVSLAHAAGSAVVDTSGPPLRAAVDSGAVATVKPNLQELGECLGRRVPMAEAVEAAGELLDRVDTVLLTLGEEGAYLVEEDMAVGSRCELEAGELANTVGCGDAFLAGWLHGLQVGDSRADALCWAVAAGAASAAAESTVGYSLEDVEQLLPRCEPLG
jgi:1-phosphofructokinase family hexose kinase